MIERQIAEAIRLSREGQPSDARRLFVQVLEQQPDNETAWLWLGRILPDLGQRRYCLERVLKNNPDNAQARDALDVLSVLEALQNVPQAEEHLQQRPVGNGLTVRRIGDCLVDLGYVRRDAVERIAARQLLLRQQGKEFSLGNLLLDSSLITHEQLYAAVREQEIEYQSCFN